MRGFPVFRWKWIATKLAHQIAIKRQQEQCVKISNKQVRFAFRDSHGRCAITLRPETRFAHTINRTRRELLINKERNIEKYALGSVRTYVRAQGFVTPVCYSLTYVGVRYTTLLPVCSVCRSKYVGVRTPTPVLTPTYSHVHTKYCTYLPGCHARENTVKSCCNKWTYAFVRTSDTDQTS